MFLLIIKAIILSNAAYLTLLDTESLDYIFFFRFLLGILAVFSGTGTTRLQFWQISSFFSFDLPLFFDEFGLISPSIDGLVGDGGDGGAGGDGGDGGDNGAGSRIYSVLTYIACFCSSC